jgi:molecular chaperone IbpB/HSP20 family protein
MTAKVYDDLFGLFDEIFSDSARFFKLVDNSQPARFNRLVSSSQFPPADIVCDTKTKKLTIRVALAGYSEEDINLSFDGDYLKLIVNRSVDEKEEIPEYVMQKGIKLPNHVEASWIIDPRYYNRDTVTVNYKDGLLTIEILPRDEVAPKKISLFGKLTLDKPEEKQIEENKE